MNTTKNFWIALGSFLVMILSVNATMAQSFKVNPKASELKVEGTSNIHDWEIVAKELQGTLKVEIVDGQLVEMSALDFSVVAESLKSGKGGMDKNTYKALKTDKNKMITYKLEKVKNLDCTSKSDCKITTSGYLTIAGTKKPIDLTFDAKVSDDKITLSGSTKINMNHYKVEPPTAMFGTITTGEEVTIKFKTAFSK